MEKKILKKSKFLRNQKFKVWFFVLILVIFIFLGLLVCFFCFYKPSKQGEVLGAYWYDYTWQYRNTITIDHTKVSKTDQSNFPLLINSTNADWKDIAHGGKVAQANGNDILFTASDGTTKLSHEIEKYDNSSGELIAWVKIPLVSASENTEIYIYYDNASCANQEDINGVWSDGYISVWHMGEEAWSGAPDEVVDSSGSGNHGKAVNGANTAAGWLGRNGEFDSASSQYVLATTLGSFGSGLAANPTTLGTWVRTSSSGEEAIGGSYNGGTATALDVRLNWKDNAATPGYIDCFLRGDLSKWLHGYVYAPRVFDGTWHHVVVIIKPASLELAMYMDGASLPVTYVSRQPLEASSNFAYPWTLAARNVRGTSSWHFDGGLDEYRLSNVARSADWLVTEYNNQSSPATFYSVSLTKKGDTTPPLNPTVFFGYDSNAKTVILTSGNWYNYVSPYFEFSGASDPESGVAGYYIYWGTDAEADPYTAGDYQAHAGLPEATQSYTVSSDLISNQIYYLRLKTKSNASGEFAISSAQTYFVYRFENEVPDPPEYVNVTPVGCSTASSFTFTWPESIDPISGTVGYQYKLGSTGAVQEAGDILTFSAEPYQEGDNVFYVRTKDNAGNVSSWQTAIFCSTAVAYVIDGPEVSAGPSSLVINWVSSKQTTGYVQVYKGNEYVSEQGHSEYGFNHSVKVVGLVPETTYRYQLRWLDQSANIGESEWFFTSTSTAPAISDFESEIINPYRVLVSWKSSEDCQPVLSYGVGSASNSITVLGYASFFSQVLDNLEGGKTYVVRIKSTTRDDYTFYSDYYSFTTPPLPDISSLRFETIENRAEPAIKATWVTNVETTSTALYGPQNSNKQEISKSDLVKDHGLEISGLADNTIYEFIVKGTDKYGNSVQSAVNTFTTPVDSRPPKISNIVIETSNIGLDKQDKAQIAVSWETDEPATSMVEYSEGLGETSYTNSTVEDKALTENHLVIISELVPSKPHHLRVVSADKAGNITRSEDSTVVTGDVPKSVLQLILKTLNNIFGWLGGML